MKARHLARFRRWLRLGKFWSLPLVGLVAVVVTQSGARAQSKAAWVPDITGSWERHGAGPGARAGGPRDATIPPPAPQPQLKPPYAKEWQDRIMAVRAADAKGEPLATNYTDCLPDGMPTMMG